MKRYSARLRDLLGVAAAVLLVAAWLASHYGEARITIALPRAEISLWNDSTLALAEIQTGPVERRPRLRITYSREMYLYSTPMSYPHVSIAGIVFYRAKIYSGCISMFRPIPPPNGTSTGFIIPLWMMMLVGLVCPIWWALRRILRRKSRHARGFALAHPT
jgi:hypothetical protein